MMTMLTPEKKAAIEKEIKMLLHAHRDCLRDIGVDTRKVRVNATDGYYGEAFGIMRGLKLLGLGDFGPINVEGNLASWFCRLEDEVLVEENFGGSGICEHCMNRYGKDDSTHFAEPQQSFPPKDPS